VVGLAPRAPWDSVRPRRLSGRVGSARRASFDLSAAFGIVRPLNFTVRRHGNSGIAAMYVPPWLQVLLYRISGFLLGGVGMWLFSSALGSLRSGFAAIIVVQTILAGALVGVGFYFLKRPSSRAR
jgi:hypothetical protein